MIRIDLSPRPKTSPSLRWGFALTAIGLLAASQGHAVLDGRPTTPGEFPAVFGFQAVLREETPSAGGTGVARGYCTAFLVHPKLLLTAAHCVNHAIAVTSAANGPVPGGKNTERGTSVRISEFKSHPDYVDIPLTASHRENVLASRTDIAFLVLRTAVTDVTPYSLFVSSDNLKMMKLHNLDTTVVGYGATKWSEIGNYTHARTGVKHTGSKPITGLERGYFLLDGEKNKLLPGDSGGPVIIGSGPETRVAGIVHGGFNGKKTVLNKRGKKKTVRSYGTDIATMLTPKLLCWVEKESGIDLADIECEADGTPKQIPLDFPTVITPVPPTSAPTPGPSPRN